ncbi:MAG: hypothetical protein ACOC5J_03275 [Gemmatimonadota bacterium]
MSPGLLCVVTLLAAAPSPVSGQELWAGARVQSYVMSEPAAVRLHDIRLVSLPFGARLRPTPWARLSVTGAHAEAEMTLPNGETGTVSGVTDTRVALEGSWRNFTLTGGAMLPTGTVVRNVEEATVVGLLASELLPFALSEWGTGGAYGGDLAYTVGLGRTTVGLSAGYLAVREFTPLGDESSRESNPFDAVEPSYHPGSQVRGRLALDTRIGEADVLSVLVGLQRFGTDTYDEQNVFQPGTRFESLVSYAFPVGARESALLYGGYYDRGAGSLVWSLQAPPELGDVFPGASPSVSRQLFLAGSELRIARRRFDVAPRAELRVLRSGEGLGQGWLASVSGRGTYRVLGKRYGGRLLVEPTAGVRFGRVVPEKEMESEVLGWEAGFAVRWDLGR